MDHDQHEIDLSHTWKMFIRRLTDAQPLGLMVMPLPTEQEVLCFIPSSAMGFFSSGELFHGVSVFRCLIHVLSCVIFREGLCTLLTIGLGGPTVVFMKTSIL